MVCEIRWGTKVIGAVFSALGLSWCCACIGAVAISLSLDGCSMLFVGCHLHAHHSNTRERNAAYWRAERGLSLCPHDFEFETERVTDRFDRVFWLGDMNYRINGLRRMVDKLISTHMHEVCGVCARACVGYYEIDVVDVAGAMV